MQYYCDDARHLICLPYTVENLHRMADDLGIKRCWYHSSKYSHYDIPKRRVAEIQAKCIVVTSKDLLKLINME
jgi:hypothetical protein